MKKFLFTSLLVIAAALMFIGWLNLPIMLIPKMEKFVSEECDKCKIKIESMSLTPTHKLAIRFNGINFEYNPNDQVHATFESIYITIPWSTLFSKEYIVDGLAFVKPDVVYTDGDNKTVSTISEPKLPIFVIENTQIINGKFRYNRHTQGTKSSFHIQNINGEISTIGNTELLKEKATQLKATGQVENSGESNLTLTTFLWANNTYIDTEFKVKDQNLHDLSIFLKDNAGVTLSGTLLKGETLMQIRDKNLRTFLLATYDHFDIQFDPTYDRNEITTFFMNFSASILVNKKNTSAGDPTREFVDITREPKEPIVGFMLRGLKEAAIQLVRAQPL